MTPPSDASQQAADLIRARLAEIDRERKQLERAITSLVPTTQNSPAGSRQNPAARTTSATRRRATATKRQGPRTSKGHRRTPSRRKTRARPGQRQAELLKQIRANPGAPVSQLAKSMGVAPTQLYPIARRLTAQGEIKKHERGFAPK
jgi:hypothetical protein